MNSTEHESLKSEESKIKSIKMVKSWNTKLFEYILLEYRWVFVIFFLLPVSIVFEIYSFARNCLIFKLKTAPLDHIKRVKYVQQQVKEWKNTASNRQMCTARPAWQTMSFRQGRYKSTMFNVQVDLYDILEINTDKGYVRVEPMVSMGQLSRALNPLGWTIPVLPEIDDLTVGGLIMGTGIETSSHKYGLFQHTCIAYEIVLCDGSLVKCSREENSELFHSIPWSHGSIGFLVSAYISIIPARKFVRLEYQPVYSMYECNQVFRRVSFNESYDFVEAIVFSPGRAVVMFGNMVDSDENAKVNAIGHWYKPWFFKHVETKLDESRKDAFVELIPLRDYYHRHTRSLFWEVQDILTFGNSPIFRYVLGWTMPPKVSLLKLTQTQATKELYEKAHIIQDMLIPIGKLQEALSLFQETVQVYPLWLCPFKLTKEPGFVHSPPTTDAATSTIYVDIGVYGIPRALDYEAERTTRRIEKFVRDVQGYQMLYADTFATRDEFRQMFDHTLYDKVRKLYNCEAAFPEVYDKVSKAARI